MTTNPIAPDTRDDDEKVGPVAAVVLGLLTDKVGSAAALFPLGIGYASYLKEAGLSAADISARVAAVGFASAYGLLVTALCLLFSFWGGYVCARFARERIMASGVSLAALSGLIFMALSFRVMPLWESAVLTVLTATVVMTGVALGCKKK